MDIGGGGRGRYYVHRTDALTSVAFCVALILLPLILIAAGRASARPVRPSLIYNEATVSSQMVGWGDVGRPDKGTAGTQLNHPLKNGEKARVGPHSHGVTLTDNGHGHSISDPGHSHHLGIQEYSGNTIGGGEHTGMGSSNTDASPTGISIDSAKSNIDISVDETTSEGYPLAYVLLCQHATRSLVH